jgi:hypothetical protein
MGAIKSYISSFVKPKNAKHPNIVKIDTYHQSWHKRLFPIRAKNGLRDEALSALFAGIFSK